MQTPNFAHQMPPMQSTSGATTLLRPPFPPPLTMADHVASVCRSAYIATDSTDTAITVGQYCNCASVHFQSPATRFCTASPTTLSSVCSQFRMLITRKQVVVNASHPFCGSYSGCRFNAVSSSSWLRCCTRHCNAVSVTQVSVGVGRRSSSPLIGCTVVCRATDQDWVTGRLMSLVRRCGTSCQLPYV